MVLEFPWCITVWGSEACFLCANTAFPLFVGGVWGDAQGKSQGIHMEHGFGKDLDLGKYVKARSAE